MTPEYDDLTTLAEFLARRDDAPCNPRTIPRLTRRDAPGGGPPRL